MGRLTHKNTAALLPISAAKRGKPALGATNGKKNRYAQADPTNFMDGYGTGINPVAFAFRTVERRAVRSFATFHVALRVDRHVPGKSDGYYICL
jgi:hypothetical protein